MSLVWNTAEKTILLNLIHIKLNLFGKYGLSKI
jgi:hypothetical protein